jgi:hypothetical protein
MTFQGIGTKFFGKNNYNAEDKSYITTKWFSLNIIPIFPIKSYRVIKNPKLKEKSFRLKGVGIKEDNLTQYNMLKEIPLKDNIGQILATYLFYYGGLGLCALSFFIFPSISLFVFCAYIVAILFNSKINKLTLPIMILIAIVVLVGGLSISKNKRNECIKECYYHNTSSWLSDKSGEMVWSFKGRNFETRNQCLDYCILNK